MVQWLATASWQSYSSSYSYSSSAVEATEYDDEYEDDFGRRGTRC